MNTGWNKVLTAIAVLLCCLLMVGMASAQDSVYTQVFFTSGTSDGYLGNTTTAGASFPGLFAGVNREFNATTTADIRLRAYGSVPDRFDILALGLYTYFDSSSLPDNADIRCATFSVIPNANYGNALGDAGYGIVGVSSPMTPGVVSAGDYYNTSSSRYASDVLHSNISSVGSRTYWNLNPLGIENVSKTGWTNIALQLSWVIDRAFTGTWLPLGNVTGIQFRTTEYGSSLPNLTVQYTIPGDPTVMGKLNNSAHNLTISTYDGSGQAVHPSVIDNGTIPWNGYRYLMVFTPYPLANPNYENPSMRYSNDGITWEMIAGQPDPIIPQPAAGFNSDPNIAVVGDRLYLFTRWADSTTPTQLWYNRTNTTDGITWGTEQTLTFPWFVRSASFIYNESGGWECLAHNVTFNNLQYFYSDASGLNFYYYGGALTGLPTSQWHSEAKLNDGQYQLLLENYQQNNLSYYYSRNGRSWFPSASNPVLIGNATAGAWDPKIYKPSFTESGNDWKVWYSAYNASNFYYIGYAEYPSETLLAQFTPAGPVALWWPNGQAFTDTSTGSPTDWEWTYQIDGIGTETPFNASQNATFFPPSQGNFLIKLNASTLAAYNISTQQTWVNTTNPSFDPNQTIAYQYPAPIAFTKTNTTIIDTVNWSFGDTYISTDFSPVQHIYTVASNYTIYLNATNSTYGYSNTTKTFELVTDDDIYLKSWLQFENATISDLKGVAWTNSGCSQSTIAPKFGTQSLVCTDGNNYIYSPPSTIWDRSAIAGEMEAWINITAYGTAGKPIIKRSTGTDGTTNGWGLFEYNTSGYFAFWYGDAATNFTTPFYLPLNTQTHLVLTRNTSQYWEVYKNGVKVDGGNYVGGLALDTANPFQIGSAGPGTEVSFRLDEFRYTQGIPRFSSDFSVPFAAYRGSLTGFIDTSPNSTYRYETNPDSIAGISNWTNGGTRNRTVQVQNISEANYLVGGGNFDPLHEQVKNVRLNLTNYSDLVLESYSINNVGGVVAYNVSRGGTNKITALFDNRTNFLDIEVLYYNYTETSADFQYFAYGTLINGTASFPVHNFIPTPITYLTWTIYPNFTASSTMVPAGTPITFTDTTYGAPAGWTNYAWTFGDGGTSTSKNPVYTYTSPGIYSVSLTTSLVANSSVTNSTTKTSYISVTGSGTGAPVASFTGTPLVTTANSTVTFTDDSTNTPTSWVWAFGDGSGSTLQNPSHSYITNGLYTVNLTATNAYGSNTLSRTDYINVTSSIPSSFVQQDIWMDGQYALTFHITDASTGAPIPIVTITDSNGASTVTTNGTGYLTEPAGTVSVCFVVSSGYTNICRSYIVDSDASYDVQLSAATETVANTNVVYQAQLYRFMFQNLIGTPLGGLSVTITPVNLTMNSTWTNQLLGISSSVDITNGVMSGTTGSDGSLGVPLITPLGYSIHILGTAYSGDYVNYTLIEYPPSSGTDILVSLPTNVTGFAHITPTPAFISYNVYNQTKNSTAETLSVNYYDPTGITNLTIVTVTNQSGYVLNKTTYTGSSASNVINNFTYVQDVTSPDGDIIEYGFSSYVSTAGGWNNVSEVLTFNGPSTFTGNATYDGWAAIIIIVLVSAAFTASTVYIGTISAGLMGLFFYYGVKWFTPMVDGTTFVAMCCFWICIGTIGFIMKRSRSVF